MKPLFVSFVSVLRLFIRLHYFSLPWLLHLLNLWPAHSSPKLALVVSLQVFSMFAKFPTWTVWQVTSLITRTWPSSWRGNSLPSRYFVKVTHQGWTFTHKLITALGSVAIFLAQPQGLLMSFPLKLAFDNKTIHNNEILYRCSLPRKPVHWCWERLILAELSRVPFYFCLLLGVKIKRWNYWLHTAAATLWGDVKMQQSVNKVRLYWWICN